MYEFVAIKIMQKKKNNLLTGKKKNQIRIYNNSKIYKFSVNQDFKHNTARTVSLSREFRDLVTVNPAKLNNC